MLLVTIDGTKFIKRRAAFTYSVLIYGFVFCLHGGQPLSLDGSGHGLCFSALERIIMNRIINNKYKYLKTVRIHTPPPVYARGLVPKVIP